MTRKVTASDAKAHLLSLLEEVALGEEVEITKHGRIMARLVPATGPSRLKGRFTGRTLTTDSADDLLSTGVAWDLP